MLVAKAVGLVAGIASNALLARLLSPAELGGYFIAFSLVTMATLAGPLGLNRAVVKFVAEDVSLGKLAHAKVVLRKILLWGDSGTFFIILLAMAARYSPWGNTLLGSIPKGGALAALALAAFFMTTSTLRGEAFLGLKDYRNAVLHRSMLQNILFIIALLLAWLYLRVTDLQSVLYLLAAACLVDYLIASFKIRRWMRSIPVESGVETMHVMDNQSLFAVSLPLWDTTILLFVFSQSALWILDWQRAAEEVALFGLAARIAQIVFRFPSNLVNTVIPPYISSLYAQGSREKLQNLLRSASTFSALITLVFALGFWAFGRSVLAVLFGSYYQNAYPYVLVLSIGELVNAWGGPAGQTLMMTVHQRALMFISMFNGVLAVVLGWFFVSWWGGLGGAWSVAIALSVYNLVMVFFLFKDSGLRTDASLVWLTRMVVKRSKDDQ